MRHGELPPGLVLQRTTDDFSAETVPPGLLHAHQVAAGVWGEIEVLVGTVEFVWEDDPEEPVTLEAGDRLMIPPEVRHHVEPGPDARFHVSFHR